MKRFRDVPIKRKLVLLSLIASTVALLLACGAAVVYELTRFRAAIVPELSTQAEIIGANTAVALAADNPGTAQETLATLRAREEIVYACLYTDDGRVFAEYGRALAVGGPTAREAPHVGHRFEGSHLTLFRPVMLEGDVVGNIYLVADLGRRFARLRGYAGIALLVMLLSLFVSLFLSARLQRFVSSPILALTRVARAVTERKDYSLRATKETSDEIGELMDGFNQMLAQIQSRDSELRSSEQRFRQLAESIREVFWLSDTEKNEILYVSPGYEEIWGRTCASLYASPRDWLEAIHPEDRPRVLQAATTKQVSGEYNEEYRIVRPDGSIRWVNDRAFPIRNEQGQVYRVTGIAEDITERKRAEAALRESEHRLQSVLDNSTAVIYLKDTRGRYLLINRRYETLFHVTRQWIAGKTDYDLFPKEIADAFRANDRKVIEAGVPLEFEEIASQDDGPHTYISIKFPLFDATGSPYGVCGISTDITQRKRAEDSVRASEKRFRDLFESSPDAIFVEDLSGAVLDVNPAACHLHGMTRDQLLGKNILALVPAEFREQVAEDFLKLERRELNALESFSLTSEGRAIPVSITTSHVEHLGKPALLLHVRDITSRRRSEEELRTAHAELKRSHEELKAAQLHLIQAEKLESIGRLAAGVAHEVKNPLAIAAMGMEYLSGALNPKDREAAGVLGEVREALARADSVIRGLLDFSAPTKLELHSEDLNAIITRTLLLIRHELGKQQVTQEIELADAIPLLRLDANKIEQVFVNICMNSIQAMSPGGCLRVRTRLAGRGDGPPVVAAEVEDNGSGIPPDKLSRVFDPFFTTKPVGKGTGLGLTVARQIVELHGGSIQIENRPEGGVRVTLTFKPEGGAHGQT